MDSLQEDQHFDDLLYYGLGDPPATATLQKSFGIVEAAATPADEGYDSEGCIGADLLRQYHQIPFLEMVQGATAGGFQLLLRMQDEQLLRSALVVGMQQQQQQHQHQHQHYAVVSAETDDGYSSMPPALQPRSSLELDSCVSHVSEELQSEEKLAPLTTTNVSAAAQAVRRRTKKVKKEMEMVDTKREEDGVALSVKEGKENKTLERKKRKRTRVSTNKRAEEVESQRMSHIAVERNRRRLMNEHLSSLRALMPPAYIQRGDQASIVGGAIEFVKELEQHLQTLLAEKHTQANFQSGRSILQPSSWAGHRQGRRCPFDEFFISPQYRSSVSSPSSIGVENQAPEGSETTTAAVADIEAAVTQTHVSLRVLVPRRAGQLLRFISTLEDMRLTVLHLNISSFDGYALYSLNLKIEDDCQLGSADEVATAVHQIFSYITCTCGYS